MGYVKYTGKYEKVINRIEIWKYNVLRDTYNDIMYDKNISFQSLMGRQRLCNSMSYY